MKRRGFLLTGLGSAWGAQRSSQPAAQRPAPAKAKITSSVMLWMLKGSIEEKLEIAAKAGLQCVGLTSEYAEWNDADMDLFKKRCQSFGLGIHSVQALSNSKDRPLSMVDAAAREAFLDAVRRAIAAAQKLDVPQISVQSGEQLKAPDPRQQYAAMVESAKRAGDLAARANVTAAIEPVSIKLGKRATFLNTCVEGLKLVREAESPNFRLLFDIYHEQIQTGNVIRTITDAAPFTAAFHVADNPGRNEPGTGELNYANIYRAIQKAGFAGYVAFEYSPTGEPIASLTKAVSEMRAALTTADAKAPAP